MAAKRRKDTYTRWDPTENMRTEEEMAAFLEACLEEAPDDAAYLARALGHVARARGMVQLAKDTGLTREGLYKALGENANPTFDTVLKVMAALGLKFAVKAA